MQPSVVYAMIKKSKLWKSDIKSEARIYQQRMEKNDGQPLDTSGAS